MDAWGKMENRKCNFLGRLGRSKVKTNTCSFLFLFEPYPYFCWSKFYSFQSTFCQKHFFSCQEQCDEWWWPDLDHGIVCGDCKVGLPSLSTWILTAEGRTFSDIMNHLSAGAGAWNEGKTSYMLQLLFSSGKGALLYHQWHPNLHKHCHLNSQVGRLIAFRSLSPQRKAIKPS